jgi:RHS repeat-associated protein
MQTRSRGPKAVVVNIKLSQRRTVAVALAALLAATLAPEPAFAAPGNPYRPLKPQTERSVPAARPQTPPAKPADPAAAAALKAPAAAPVWPAAGVATADLSGVSDPRVSARGPARPGSLPVLLDTPAAGGVLPGSVRVEMLDRAAAKAARQPVVVRVSRADGRATAGKVRFSLDYSGFAKAFGADWATRLRLVQLPPCALTAPSAPACQPVPVASTNNRTGKTLSTDVAFPSNTQAVMLAATSGPSGASGDFTATKLAASATWQAGGSSGDFSWNYPMRVPPSLGGPSPQVALAYSAQSVDGHTAASNNQPSWIGEGFEYAPGSITRSYKACSDDMGGTANNSTKTGDQCWATDNATLSLSGHSGELVRDDGTGTYRLKNDDASRVEHLTGASNGDDNGEYWRVTTSDGTQYYFGLNRLTGWTSGKSTTNSTWTAPVFGNNTGEPCHQSTFAASWCTQAWQWNLDYVVDPHGNTMSYWYTAETNNYARNLSDSSVSTYTRGGYLDRVDYGTDNRSGTDTEYTGTAPMRVVFGTADRCIPGSTCDTAHPTSWPDVPWDQNCTSTTSCPGKYAPTFFTQKRLDSVTTQVVGGSGYRDVERWNLRQSYPDPGDSTRAGLWLAGISHTGLVGGTLALPDISFVGQQLPNRVNTTDQNAPPMNWWRISYINSETGGTVGVTYNAPDCVWGSHMPASPDSNTMRCFPVYWTRDGQQTPAIDWFQKYTVNQVTETDTTGGNPRVLTTYTYPNQPAWHYAPANGTVPPARLTWSDWRGYDQVNVTQGDPGAQTSTATRFFRGMNGDHLASGGSRGVSVDGIPDDDAYAGMTRESVTYNGPGGAEVSGTVSTPWESTPTATRTVNGVTATARHTGTAVTKARTDLDGGRSARTSTVTTTFDNTYGFPTRVADGGDDAVATDDRCTINTYAPNTSAWIIQAQVRVEVYALPCGTNPTTEADVVSDTRSYYDDGAFGAAPTKGDVTKTEQAKAWTSAAVTWLTTARTGYDAYGRVVDAWDVRGNHTGTAYTPASGGPVTRRTTTTPLGWTSTNDVEPAWGLTVSGTDVNGQHSDVAYDPVGRLVSVWLPNRSKSSGQSPNTTYAYTMSNTGVTSTTTSTLNANGNYVTSYTLYDSLLRPRQIQAPSANGTGRVLTDTFFDAAGREVKDNNAYYNTDSGPGTTLFTAQDNQVPSQNVTVYDGAGRPTAQVLRSDGVEKWRTSTAYGGDHKDVTPPAGGTPTVTYTDVHGNNTELRQYHGATPTGGYDATTYQYDRRNQLASLKDAAGNTWTRRYDLLGRMVNSTDPDVGTTTTTYNDAGDLLTVTDGRGQTLAYTYDSLGRQAGEFDTTTSGPQLAGWTYDATLMPDGVTKAKGYTSSITRYVGSNAYGFTARGYTATYQPTGQNIVIPSSEGALAGTYIFTNTYNVNGSLASSRIPAGGGLTAETLSYGYDNSTGRLATLSTNYGGATSTYVTGAQYTPFAEPTVTTFSTGGKLVQRGQYYDPATRRPTELVQVKETAPSTVLDTHYTYDEAGNLTKLADTPSGGVSDTQCFGDDFAGRLVQAWTPANGDCTPAPSASALGGPAPYWQSWTLDAVGNRLSQTDHATPNGDATTTYTYPAAGAAQAHTLRSTSSKDNSGTRTASFGYDAGGNTTSRPGPHGQQTLTWDNEGHLATLADSAGTNSYVYSPTGDRLLSHDPTGATLSFDSLELRLTTGSGTVAATHFYTFNGQTVAQRTAAGVTWLGTDLQGTAQVAIDASSQAVLRRRQTPYGNVRGSAVTWGNDKGYLGGIVDPTGLVHEGAREYDPVAGRFVSPDLIIQTGDPQQIGGYAYAGNSPITKSDPTGAWGFSWKGLTDTLKAVNNGATWGGIGIMVLGGMADVGGGLLIATGVGAPLGVALEVVGTDAIVAGALTATAGVVAGAGQHIMNSVSDGGGGGSASSDSTPAQPAKPPIRDEDVQSLMKEHSGSDNGEPLSDANARKALDAPDGASRTEVAGKGNEGADVVFKDANGNVVLRREVKTFKGTYNSFDSNLSKGAGQVEGDGEVVMQGDITPEQFEQYLDRFRGSIRSKGKTSQFSKVRVRVVNSRGDTIGQAPVVEPEPPAPPNPRMGHSCRCEFE